MDAIQLLCNFCALCLCILLDYLCGTIGYTFCALAAISLFASLASYVYRKDYEKAEARIKQYERQIKRKRR